jgi:proteasome lid subunit RPN8/RPN11
LNFFTEEHDYMDKQDNVSYAAVITMTFPGDEKPVNLTVTLTPSSPVKLAQGQVKLLRDCTLAELQQFADKMEADIWPRHQETRLAELVEEGQTQLHIRLLDEQNEQKVGPAESWLEHVLILPETEPAADTAAESVSQESEQPMTNPSGSSTPETSSTEENAVKAVTDEPAGQVETAAETEIPATAAETAAGDPEVAVSEAEQVHEEREALPEPKERPNAWPDIKILGKRRPLNHPTWTAVDLLINEPAFRNAQAHSLTSLNREVAGFLIGPQPEKQPDGRYVVHISDTIIAKHTKMNGASVTYTPESWRNATDTLAEMYPDETAVIVGWYHTHPGFGIFLSGMDQFIHRNFFIQLWHVALVLDPVARRSGFFCWDRPQTKVDQYDFPWPSWAAGSW